METPEQNDPTWELLKQARTPEVSPFFARNVVREVRNLDSETGSQSGVISYLGRLFRRPAFGVCAGAVAAIAIAFAVMPSEKATSTSGEPASVATTTEEFDAATELEQIEYLGQLMAVSDPAQLDDQALSDLLF